MLKRDFSTLTHIEDAFNRMIVGLSLVMECPSWLGAMFLSWKT